tara:strand:+ start:2749 stop:3549 length:801 start_codon:yes stop_codon:yes gene_type:complete
MFSDITIILLLYKTPLKLMKNLKRLKEFRIIILDQSNDFHFKKKITKFLPKIKNYTLSKKNKGFAKGINILAKKVKTKYFFCTQPDILIDKKSILELKKTLLKNKKNSIAAVPLINKKRVSLRDIEINHMIGASFLCYKKRFIEVGMFDEDFFFYWEDIEFSKRIKEFGYKIYQSQKSKALHFNGNSSEENYKTAFIRSNNFLFGELVYDFKCDKLRIIKILRKCVQSIFLILINIFLLKYKKMNINFAKLYGIVKFLFFIMKKYL